MYIMRFNGVELPSFVKLVGREIAVLPEISVRSRGLPRQIGSSYLYTDLGSKKETLKFILIPEKAANVDSAAEQFMQWIIGDNFKPSKVEFADKAGKYCMGQFNGTVSVEDLFVYGTASMELLYSDPLSYSNTPIAFSGKSPATVGYTGVVPQPPVISVTLPADCAKVDITCSTTGKRITLNGSFKSGNKVTVDMQKKQVLLNNQANMKILSLNSEWFPLSTGNNVLKVFLNNTEVAGAAITVNSKIAGY